MAAIEKRISKDGSTSYRVKIRMKGQKPQTATFDKLTNAKKWAEDVQSAIRDGRHFKTTEGKKHTLAEAIDRYVKDILPAKSDGNQEAQNGQLAWWKHQIGERVFADITAPLISEYRDKLLKEPIVTVRKDIINGKTTTVKTERQRSNATVVRYLSALSHLFTVAVNEWEWIDTSPLQKVKKPKEPRGRVRFLSEDERERLLTACKESDNSLIYPIVVLALSTGMRQGEAMGITWNDVDFDRRRIILHDTKNGERRAAPLAGLAYDEIKRLSKIRKINTNLVFSGNRDRTIFPRTAWETAIKRANIDSFRFHDLRHSAASYLAMNGATLAEIAEVLGHKTLAMVKRYAHLSEQHTLSVVERMNQKIFGSSQV